MIVEWKDNRVVVIPFDNNNSIRLLPGFNEVNEDEWKKAKKFTNLENDYQWRFIKEVVAEKEIVTEKENKKTGEKIIEKSIEKKFVDLKDLPDEKAEEVVLDTFDIKTLEKWKKIEGRDNVRISIIEQIKNIKEYKIKDKITV